MEVQGIMLIGGGIIIIQSGVSIGIRIIFDWLQNKRQNGHSTCSQHGQVMQILDVLQEEHKEEKQTEIMANALAKALKKNGKKLEE